MLTDKAMKASELRIGNWVSSKCHGGLHTEIFAVRSSEVVGLGANPIANYTLDEIEPVPLSEEWLLKFGFDKSVCDGTPLFDLKEDNLPLFFNGDINGFMEVVVDIEPQVRVQYVHQLQNLYYALSGKELTLKP